MAWLKFQLIVVKDIYHFRNNLINEKNTTQQYDFIWDEKTRR